MSYYEDQEIANELNCMKNPYDGDDESYELFIINRKKELSTEIDLLKEKYENDIEELEYIYFGYHAHYHQALNNLETELNQPNYNFNPGEKAYIKSQILVNKKNLNDQFIIIKEKKIETEKKFEDKLFSLKQEILHLEMIYEQSLHYKIQQIEDITMSMQKLSA